MWKFEEYKREGMIIMAYDDVSSVQFIDGRKVDIEKLSSEEADALLDVVEKEIQAIEENLEKLLLDEESEAID